MMKSSVVKEINKQIQEEIYSAYLYLSMAAYARDLDMDGFGNWFEVQFKEEMDHALGFYYYLISRGEQVEFLEIAKPPKEFKGIKSLFGEALKHEQHVTARIHFLYELAHKEKDYAFESFLKWYIDEQVEEEENATVFMDRVNKASEPVLMMIDQELMTRAYTPATILPAPKA